MANAKKSTKRVSKAKAAPKGARKAAPKGAPKPAKPGPKAAAEPAPKAASASKDKPASKDTPASNNKPAAKLEGLFTLGELTKAYNGTWAPENGDRVVYDARDALTEKTIAEIVALPNLQALYLRQLAKFPKELCSLPRLQYLYLANTNITGLPEEIGGLKQLREINLGSCKKLTSLPEGIGGCENLGKIDVRFSAIKSMPKALGSLSKLRTVQIFGCDIAPAVVKKVAPGVKVEK